MQYLRSFTIVSRVRIGIAVLLLPFLAACSTTRSVPSENFNERKDSISILVIHHTSSNFEDSLNILTKPSSNSVSSHYLVPDPSDSTYADDTIRVYKLVDESKRAWHAGRSYWAGKSSLNDSSIGIEVVNQTYCVKPDAPAMDKGDTALSVRSVKRFCFYPDFPESQLLVLTGLIDNIIKRNPQITPVNIVGHSDIAPDRKIDPGPRFPWQRLYKLGYGAWFDDETAVKYWNRFIESPVPISNVQAALNAYGYKVEVTGLHDTQTRNALQAFQLHFRPSEITGDPSIESTAILYALIEKYRPERLEELLLYPQGIPQAVAMLGLPPQNN
ncbi:N-acetylmuramoyl-L-alanine amidase [Robiginitomaculum antarcticum]|uniref:N-acetylmuramoyl-L-alanine amidase n=1 Tax=Robiginitomaculum antarcticum TaxID=437507 RepID=UPI001F32E2C3|nr:N-acetylmuramoyl-L-alanine amidase [Robiginitomaculum antarcticum]